MFGKIITAVSEWLDPLNSNEVVSEIMDEQLHEFNANKNRNSLVKLPTCINKLCLYCTFNHECSLGEVCDYRIKI